MIRRLLSACLLTAAVSAPAVAQTDLTVDRTLTAGGASYTSFSVTTAGTFDIWTTSRTGTAGTTPFDAVIWLFGGLGTGGSSLGNNDDGCFAFLTQCGPAVSFANAILNDIGLGVGDYTIAVGGFGFSESEARSGINSGNGAAGDYSVRIASLSEFGGGTGAANIVGTTVPEPGTSALLVAGLIGVGLAAKRRRAA